MKGIELLNNPFLNKGTAFTNEERKQLGLEGLLPVNVRTLEQQVEQCMNNSRRNKPILRNVYF